MNLKRFWAAFRWFLLGMAGVMGLAGACNYAHDTGEWPYAVASAAAFIWFMAKLVKDAKKDL